MRRRILVFGSNGVLGKHIVDRVIQSFGVECLILSDYKVPRLEAQRDEIGERFGTRPAIQVVDVHSPESVRQSLDGVDLAIIALPQEEPLIQRHCLARGIDSIDLSVAPRFIEKALELNGTVNAESTQLLTGGLFPGLSGILAAEVNARSQGREPIDVALLQSVEGTNGKSGVADMLHIFDQDVELMTNESAIKHRGFSLKKRFTFPEPFSDMDLRLANFVERDILRRRGLVSNYWTAFDRRGFNTLIGFLKGMGFLKLFKHPRLRNVLGNAFAKQKQSAEHIALCARSSRQEILLTLRSDYEATAASALAFAKALIDDASPPRGLRFPFELWSWDEIKAELDDVIV